jgi:DNA-binding NtrC family response regulator
MPGSSARDRIADARTGEARLIAEIDRAVRYLRPVTVALVRTADDAMLEAIAAELRPMDLVAETAERAHLLILPELGRAEGRARVETLVRGNACTIVLVPEDAATLEAVVARLHDHPIHPEAADDPHAAPTGGIRGQLGEIERTAISAALEANHGNQTKAALQLGLSRRALIYKMEKYGLKAAPNRGDS